VCINTNSNKNIHFFKPVGKSFFDVLSLFRGMNNEIQAQTMQLFVCVGMSNKEEIPMTTLAPRLGLSQASVSRNVSFFMKENRYKEKGLGLLETREDPMERRKKLVKLTNKGKMFYDQIEDALKVSKSKSKENRL
tara:strand:- start:1231 stop:1635 length:405 start_codon:yes stop_codon:yes gene_type:complete